MGATKDLFMQLREEEVMTKNFLPTKKELVKSEELNKLNEWRKSPSTWMQ